MPSENAIPPTVVVTGGASSLGLAICRRFIAQGAKVYALDIIGIAAADLPGLEGLEQIAADLLLPAQIEAAFERIRSKENRIDILVNNVGLPGPRKPVEDVTLEEWQTTISGSLGAAFCCTKLVVPQMKERRSGSIVNISTSSVTTGLPNRTPYVVAKAALEAFTTNCARELGQFNVRINAVRPGPLDNSRLRRIIQRQADESSSSFEAAEANFLRYFSMRAMISLEEVAEFVVFLAGDRAKHVTGQCIGVDGNAEWEE